MPLLNKKRQISEETRRKMSVAKKGKPTNGKPFVKGMTPWNVGISPDEETRYKIGSANRGKTFSEEVRKNMSDAKIGQNTWSKGRKASEETKQKMRDTRKDKPGHPCSEETKEKLRKALTGRILSPERRKSISEGHKGLIKSPELCAKISAIHTGMKYSDATKAKLRKRWDDYSPERKKEIIKKMLKISIPNKAELFLADLLEKMYPGDWKFVGNGQVIIAGKCPDFINVNGQKKIIEFYGERWHQGDDPKDREAVFAPYGYSTLVIWGKELRNMEVLTNRISNFCNSPHEAVA